MGGGAVHMRLAAIMARGSSLPFATWSGTTWFSLCVQRMNYLFQRHCHELLCTKLETYGICGVAYDWIKSYLHNRKQYVSVDGYSSNLLH